MRFITGTLIAFVIAIIAFITMIASVYYGYYVGAALASVNILAALGFVAYKTYTAIKEIFEKIS